jgi:hypothetical protein
MPPETEPTYYTEQDVEFDAMGLRKLASEMSADDVLQAYRGMVEKYVGNGQPAFARALQEKSAELWENMPAAEKVDLQKINATIEE